MNFTISEFNISRKPIPQDIADKILKWHIVPMQRVRDIFGKAIWPSQKSDYRSKVWELSKGRNGNSQHVFRNQGAVDWTCHDFKANHKELLSLILKHTDYTRMAMYNGFIHCDYKSTRSGQRELYKSGNDSKWKFDKFV